MSKKIFAKDSDAPKYHLLIYKHKQKCQKHFNNSKAVSKFLIDVNDFHTNIDECKSKHCKVLIVFDDMIADMLRNRKFTQGVSKLLFVQED